MGFCSAAQVDFVVMIGAECLHPLQRLWGRRVSGILFLKRFPDSSIGSAVRLGPIIATAKMLIALTDHEPAPPNPCLGAIPHCQHCAFERQAAQCQTRCSIYRPGLSCVLENLCRTVS